ncbi:MAG: response regulator receiver protein [Sphingopyxis sp.]|nr:MAG: response regulator receiver protein [Sphingopyxis sp.]
MNDFSTRLREFERSLPKTCDLTPFAVETLFECLRDESLFGSVDDVKAWYQSQLDKNQMASTMIPLRDCRGWSICSETGSIVHESGEFFRVDGIRVNASPSREVVRGWDQPILTQVGYDGGILGLLRKRFDDVPHYLVEAKAEPGNYNIVQITTTIQATFSNLKRAHKGKNTPYAEFFTDPEANGATVLIDQWMSEDGGRLNNKRNKTMLVEIPENASLKLIDSRYRWVSLFQLKSLSLTEDAIIAPHIRGVLAVV